MNMSFSKCFQIHHSRILSAIFKRTHRFKVVYLNRDGREIFKNLIGCLEDWELEKTDKYRRNQNPGLVNMYIGSYQYNQTYNGFFQKKICNPLPVEESKSCWNSRCTKN